ncbi:MAG: hypothetical protein ACO3A4_02220 [Silvanigrellaceae bacterium]
MNQRSSSWELEQIEQSLRERFLECTHESNHFIVRFIGTSGEIGHRCLTFNIEVCEEQFASEKKFLEKFVDDLRSDGWDVDELRQPLSATTSFNARLWVMIYEDSNKSMASREQA